MAKPIANVNSLTDTFEQWLEKTNELCNMATHNAVTVDNTAIGATVSGNGTVKGYLGANTIGAGQLSGRGANLQLNDSTANIILVSTLHGANGVVITANTIGVKTSLGGMNSSFQPANLVITTNTIIQGTLTVNGFNTDLLIGVQTVNGDVRPNANGLYNLGNTTAVWETLHCNNIVIYNGNVTAGNTRINLNTISVGNSETNVTVNSTVITVGGPVVNNWVTANGITGTANNANNLGGLPASSYATITYANNIAANAYSNAITYSSNATNITNGEVSRLRLPAANTSNSGIVQLVDIAAPFTNTSIVHAPTANTIRNLKNYVDSQIVGVGAVTPQYVDDKAANAYANAILYSSNASTLASGTVPIVRLPDASISQKGIVQLADMGPSFNNPSIIIAPTANTISQLYANLQGQINTIGAGYVTNTYLHDTWAGTANLTTLGTITTGTWNATTIAVSRGGTSNTSFTQGLIFSPGTTNPFRTATASEIVAAIGTTRVANAVYADSAGSAGALTNAVTFNDSGAGAVSGTTYNGATARTISYNTVGAQAALGYTPTRTVSSSSPLSASYTGANVAISMTQASGSANGWLSSTDWTTFNSKQAALGFTPVQQGGGAGQSTNKVYIGWTGTALKSQVDATDQGEFVLTGYSTNQALQLNRLGLGGLDVSGFSAGTLRCVSMLATGAAQAANLTILAGGSITGGPSILAGSGTFSSLQCNNNLTVPQGEIQVGTELIAGQKIIKFYNSSRKVYLTLAASGGTYGLWDETISAWRWNTDNSGNFTATGNITAYSDIRLKKDLSQIRDALGKVTQLTGYTFTRTDTQARQTGLLAQEVKEVLPEAVLDDGEYLSLAYGNLAGLLVEAIKEISAKVDKIEQRLNT